MVILIGKNCLDFDVGLGMVVLASCVAVAVAVAGGDW